MSDDPDPFSQDAQFPAPGEETGSGSTLGAVLSFACLILLAFILRLAVPPEDNAVELGLLLIAVGFAQIWLIFNFLKSFRK